MYRINSGPNVGPGTGSESGKISNVFHPASNRKVYVRQDVSISADVVLDEANQVSPRMNIQRQLNTAGSNGDTSRAMFFRANSDIKVRPGNGYARTKGGGPVALPLSPSFDNSRTDEFSKESITATSISNDIQKPPIIRHRVSVLDLKPDLHYNAITSNFIQNQQATFSAAQREPSDGTPAISRNNQKSINPAVADSPTPTTPLLLPSPKLKSGYNSPVVPSSTPKASTSVLSPRSSPLSVNTPKTSSHPIVSPEPPSPNIQLQSKLSSSTLSRKSSPSLRSSPIVRSFPPTPAERALSPLKSVTAVSSPDGESSDSSSKDIATAEQLTTSEEQRIHDLAVSPALTIHRPLLQSVETLPTSDISKARADRKIKDLEITNSSLLSINRYLEKKIRHQKADIEFLSNGASSASLNYHDSATNIYSHDTDEGTDDEYDGNDNLTDDYSDLDISLADSTILEHVEERTRAHISFLKSAEKFDTTLRQCLLITDNLLRDGYNSLDYAVDPSDIGERVVEPIDDE